MKKTLALLLLLATVLCLLAGCGKNNDPNSNGSNGIPDNSALGDDDDTFGAALDDTGIYNGYFEEESTAVNVVCISGTNNAYSLNGTTLTFSGISEDTVYSVSGKLKGNIVIDIAENYKLELEFTGFSLVSTEVNPIQIKSGNKVTVTAKKDTENYIYDMRAAVEESDTSSTKGAIHSDVDLQIGGKGSLAVVSENNNGIHTKDDLEIKNLTLTVACENHALKGNDSVEITNGTITLIAKSGDGIKTVNSDISEKGKQRGTVTVSECNLTIYAACDGIDASYNAVIDGETTVLNIYTDKYSNYSKEVTATATSEYYIRFTSNSYKYSVKYYNSDSSYEWVDATYHSTVFHGNTRYYYYSFPQKTAYSKIMLYVYSSSMQQGQETDYQTRTDYLTPNTAYDTLAITSNNVYWTNYATTVSGGGPGGGPGGPGGGMNEGNSEKGDHSTKGIKVANEILIHNGSVTIKSYDDALHSNNTTALENGATPLGNITVTGGNIILYSNDDGIHAENIVSVKGGNIEIVNSYEGVEGLRIVVSGGNVFVYAKDDGMNATALSGAGITLSGGYVFIYCTGDGLDTNSKTSYAGISFEGGNAVIIANSNGNSAIDTEQGYKYTAGSIVAIMPSGGMKNEAVKCQSFSSLGTSKSMNLSGGSTLTISGDMNQTITMPCSISNAFVVILNKNISVKNGPIR